MLSELRPRAFLLAASMLLGTRAIAQSPDTLHSLPPTYGGVLNEIVSGVQDSTTKPATNLAPPFPPADAEELDLDQKRLDVLVKRVAALVANGNPVGAELLMIKNRRTVLHETFGWRDRELERPVQKNTICRIRSMTKPIVATAIWMLIDEGKLALEDPVAKHLKSFDNERSGAITVDHLLTHTAGFEHPGYPESPENYASLRALVDAAGKAGPEAAVGSRYGYSDADTATLAALIELHSGGPAEEFIRSRVLEPLGMADTFCKFETTDPRAERVSSTHIFRDGGFERYWDPSQEQFMPFFRGSGGIYSTPMDYARFLAFWMDRCTLGERQLVPENLVLAALTSTPMSVRPGPPRHYARHFEIYGSPATVDELRANGLPVFGHTGSDGTVAIACPEKDMIVLYFTQSRDSRYLGAVLRPLIEMLLE